VSVTDGALSVLAAAAEPLGAALPAEDGAALPASLAPDGELPPDELEHALAAARQSAAATGAIARMRTRFMN
jgi:hypothetical protein